MLRMIAIKKAEFQQCPRLANLYIFNPFFTPQRKLVAISKAAKVVSYIYADRIPMIFFMNSPFFVSKQNII